MVREVDDLSLTLDGMRRTIGHFLEISASLGAERNVDDLLSCLLKESIGASAASAGALYLAHDPGQAPSPAPVRFLPTLVMGGEHQGDSQALEPLDEADLASMLQRGRFD